MSYVRVELFKKLTIYPENYPGSFIVSGDYFRKEMFRITARISARYRLQRIFLVRTILHLLQSFLSFLKCSFNQHL